MGERFLATAENLGFDFGMDVIVRPDQLLLVFVKPVEKAAALFVRETQHGFSSCSTLMLDILQV